MQPQRLDQDSRTMGGAAWRAVAVVAALAVAVAACDLPLPFGSGDRAPEKITELPRALTAQEVEVLEASSTFGLELVRELMGEAPERSHFLSPLSASMALGMALNGAEGETFEAVAGTLGFEAHSLDEINTSYRGLLDLLTGLDRSVTVGIANSFWYRDRFRPLDTFSAAVQSGFDADVRGVDFDAPDAIATMNGWVDRATRGRIKEMVSPPIDQETVALLLNAVYFQGDWTHRFDPADTREADFHLLDGSTAPIQLMHRTGGFSGLSTADYVAADIPYGGEAFVMTVVVPEPHSSLPEVMAGLDEAGWRELMGRLDEQRDAEWEDGRLYLPRITLEWERSLKDALSALGMEVAFDSHRADFPHILDPTVGFPPEGGWLWIQDVRQKTFLAVDEDGTEAAAATQVTWGMNSGPPIVRADRPFLLAIRERLSGAVLFLGAIVEPPAG